MKRIKGVVARGDDPKPDVPETPPLPDPPETPKSGSKDDEPVG